MSHQPTSNGSSLPNTGPEPWRVLYIAGWGRSGSTLLTALLDQLPGAFGAGEVRSLWARGALAGRRCGCGRPVPHCPIWGPVLDRLRDAPMAAAEVATVQRSLLRSRHYPRAVLAALAGRPPGEQIERYVATYRQAYAAIADATGASVIIDSSKYPLDLYHLARAGVPVEVVQLVRHPRAVAHSWSRPKPLHDGPDQADLKQFSPGASSTIWTLWNTTISLLVKPLVGTERSTVLRFEDFVADPGSSLRSLARFAGLDQGAVRVHNGAVDLAENHLVAGNGDRFTQGIVTIDERDQSSALSTSGSLLATVPALPLLHHFGYPVRSKVAAPTASAGPARPPTGSPDRD